MSSGADYEHVSPETCEKCGGSDFERRGRVGRWDGARGGGCIYEAVCLTCRTIWECRSDPFEVRDKPKELRWWSYRRAEPGAAPDRGI